MDDNDVFGQDDGTVVTSKFERKLAEKLAQQAKQNTSEQSTAAEPNWNDLSLDAPSVDQFHDPIDEAITKAIKGMDIVDAYNRWIPKKKCNPGSRRESIKVSCPNPAHPDKDPSCWLNRDKNVFYCSRCGGGDVYDIAAHGLGFPVPEYKQKETFRLLRHFIGRDLGIVVDEVQTTTSGDSSVPSTASTDIHSSSAEQGASEPKLESSPETLAGTAKKGGAGRKSSAKNVDTSESISQQISSSTPSTAGVGLLPAGAEAKLSSEQFATLNASPRIDWQSIFPEGTFLCSWMRATTMDDCPEEFHFWTGLMAVGFAIGRSVLLMDAPPVIGNLFTVLVGPSGTKKGHAVRHLRNIIADTLPYNEEDPFSSGTRDIGSAGSGEYLISQFSAPIEDPINPKKLIGYAPVRGLAHYEEFSSLVKISARAGSTLQTGLMDLYDAQRTIRGGSQTHGKRVAHLPFGQTLSTTQPDSLANLLNKGDDASGFINRWIFASGYIKPVRSWGGVPVDLTEPSAKLKTIHLWGMTDREVNMTDAALHLWDEFFHATLHPTKLKTELERSWMLNRVDLTLKKVILLLTANQMLTEVTVDIVKAAIELFPYLSGTYTKVNNQLTRTEETDHGNAILDAVRELTKANGIPPTKRELVRACQKAFPSYKEAAIILKNLVDLELLTEVAPPAGSVGRPTWRYKAND